MGHLISLTRRETQKISKASWPTCRRKLLKLHKKQWTSSALKRRLLTTSSALSTNAKVLHGIVLLAETSAPLSHTKPSTSSTSTSATAPSSFSRRSRSSRFESLPAFSLYNILGGDTTGANS